MACLAYGLGCPSHEAVTAEPGDLERAEAARGGDVPAIAIEPNREDAGAKDDPALAAQRARLKAAKTALR